MRVATAASPSPTRSPSRRHPASSTSRRSASVARTTAWIRALRATDRYSSARLTSVTGTHQLLQFHNPGKYRQGNHYSLHYEHILHIIITSVYTYCTNVFTVRLLKIPTTPSSSPAIRSAIASTKPRTRSRAASA